MAIKPRLKWGKEGLILEIPTLIRVPVSLEAIKKSATDGIKLTPQEQKVLDGLLKGWGNKEIANAINLTEGGVKFHVSNLLLKFMVRTRGEIQSMFAADRG